MRIRINLVTMSDIEKFVEVVSRVPEQVFIEDGQGSRVTAKSLMFTATAKMYWDEMYCYCERDISGRILPWIV